MADFSLKKIFGAITKPFQKELPARPALDDPEYLGWLLKYLETPEGRASYDKRIAQMRAQYEIRRDASFEEFKESATFDTVIRLKQRLADQLKDNPPAQASPYMKRLQDFIALREVQENTRVQTAQQTAQVYTGLAQAIDVLTSPLKPRQRRMPGVT